MRRPVLALLLGLGCCALASLGALRVRLETQITALLPSGHPALERFTEVQERFGSTDLLGLALELPPDADAEDEIRARRGMDVLGSVLDGLRWRHDGVEEPMITWIEGRYDPAVEAAFQDLLLANTWLFCGQDALRRSERLQAALRPVLGGLRPLAPRLVADLLDERLRDGIDRLVVDPSPLGKVAYHLRPRRDKDRIPSLLRRPSPSIPAQLQDRDPLGLWTNVYLPWWQDQLDATVPLKREGDHLRSRDSRYYLLLCQALHPASHSHFTLAMAERMRQVERAWRAVQAQTGALMGHVGMEWTDADLQQLGPYFIAERDYANAKEGAWLSLTSSLGGVLLLFALAYRSLRLPALIACALLPAVGAALGLAAVLLGGSLTMICTAFAAILIGLGVDFVIHLYNGYIWSMGFLVDRHGVPGNRRRARRMRAIAAAHAMQKVGAGIVAAGITSIGTFLILLLSRYRGLTELGAVCGIGLLLILVQLLLVVPAFLVLAGPLRPRPSRLLAPLGRSLVRRPWRWATAMVLLLASAALYVGSRDPVIVYDRDPRNLRPAEDALFEEQLQLIDRLGLLRGGHQLLLRGEDPVAVLSAGQRFIDHLQDHDDPTAFRLAAPLDTGRLQAEGVIARLPIDQLDLSPDELAGRLSIDTPLGRLRCARITPEALYGVEAEAQLPLEEGVLEAGSELVLLPLVTSTEHPLMWFAAPDAQRQAMGYLERDVDWVAVDEALASLEPQLRKDRAPFLRDLEAMRSRIAARDPLMPGDLADTPLGPLLAGGWHQGPGQTLLRLPLDLSHRTGQPGFEAMLGALGLAPDGSWTEIAPGVEAGTAGPPSIAHVLQRTLTEDFSRLTWLALLVTVLLLTLTMRHVMGSLHALAALGGGVLLALAAMHLLGMSWNMMNIAVLPLVIGIGIDNGIHFVHALHRTGAHGSGIQRAVEETGHPILITALTSIIGFGSLALNAYRGVQSVGITAVLGIGGCLLVALIGLPLLARIPLKREQLGTRSWLS